MKGSKKLLEDCHSNASRVLPSRDPEIRGATVRIAKTNTTLKRPVNSLFGIENVYHDNNHTDKASHGER